MPTQFSALNFEIFFHDSVSLGNREVRGLKTELRRESRSRYKIKTGRILRVISMLGSQQQNCYSVQSDISPHRSCKYLRQEC